MDKIYTDFTTKLLPQIQEGLMITKDYFIDLFGRYIKYLLITDSIGAIVFFIAVWAFLWGAMKTWKYGWQKPDSDYGSSNFDDLVWPIFVFIGLIGGIVIFVIAFWIGVENVVKDIYIPEVRIYESLKSQTTHNNN